MPVWDPTKSSPGRYANGGLAEEEDSEYYQTPTVDKLRHIAQDSEPNSSPGYENLDEGFGPKSFSPLGAEISVMLDRHHKSFTEHLDGWMEHLMQHVCDGRGCMSVVPVLSHHLSHHLRPLASIVDPASSAKARAQLQMQQHRADTSALSASNNSVSVGNASLTVGNVSEAILREGSFQDGELKSAVEAPQPTGALEGGNGAQNASSSSGRFSVKSTKSRTSIKSHDSVGVKRYQSNNSSHVIENGLKSLTASMSISRKSRVDRASVVSAGRPSVNRLDSTVYNPDSADSLRKNAATKLGANADQIAARNSKAVFEQTLPPGRCDHLREYWRPCVQSFQFELLFASMIITNSIIVGIQVQAAAEDPSSENSAVFMVIQHFYAIIFLFELLMRIFVEGMRGFLCSDQWMWNFLDIIIVTSSLLEVAVDIAHLASGESGEEVRAGGADLSNIRVVRIIRIARLMRVFRIIRIVRFIRALRTLVYSIICTLKSLIWAMLLLVMIIYVFGILFTQAASDHLDLKELLGVIDPDYGVDCRLDPICLDANLIFNYWGSLPRSMFTLLKAISGGVSWELVVEPLSSVGWFWVMLFNAFILFVYFAVLNVVTGVFCQSAIESAQHDQDMIIQEQIANKNMYVEKVKTLFKNIDEDSSGYITITEFERHLEDENVRAYFASMELDTTDAWTLFKLIDMEEAHIIDIEEFVMGCLRLKGPAKSIDIAKLMYENKFMSNRLRYFIKYCEAQFEAIGTGYLETQEGSVDGQTNEGTPFRVSKPASAVNTFDSRMSRMSHNVPTFMQM